MFLLHVSMSSLWESHPAQALLENGLEFVFDYFNCTLYSTHSLKLPNLNKTNLAPCYDSDFKSFNPRKHSHRFVDNFLDWSLALPLCKCFIVNQRLPYQEPYGRHFTSQTMAPTTIATSITCATTCQTTASAS